MPRSERAYTGIRRGVLRRPRPLCAGVRVVDPCVAKFAAGTASVIPAVHDHLSVAGVPRRHVVLSRRRTARRRLERPRLRRLVEYPDLVRQAADGLVPGGTRRNLSWIKSQLEPGEHNELTQLLFADAQTSGGLIFGVDPAQSSTVLASLADTGHTAAVVGNTVAGTGIVSLV